MNYRDLNRLFNDSSFKYAGSGHAARRLEKRKWQLNSDAYTFAGIAPAKGGRAQRLEAHFTCTKSKDGGCWHNRITVDIGSALDCLSGDLSKALADSFETAKAL